jgi:hypothetical protein
MSGGTISGNSTTTDSFFNGGGGVYVYTDGTFTTSGGTIYGKDEGANSNTAYADGKGHAVSKWFDLSTFKYRDTTAGPGDAVKTSTGTGLQ